MEAKQREYVIDIDMNDYDGIRTCCKGKKLCNSCWKYMEAAYKVLRELLSQIFGFTQILWVFSGRRGMHAWVCDQEARVLESSHRKAITNFLNVALNNEMCDRLVIPESLEKMNTTRIFQISKNILFQYESFLFEEQNFLADEKLGAKNFERILSILKRHYKENKMEMNQEGYINLKTKIFLETPTNQKSLSLFRGTLDRYMKDIKYQKHNLTTPQLGKFI